MSISKNKISELKEKFNCTVFFETGFYHGTRFDLALKCGFKKVVCIELLYDFVNNGKNKFKKEIQNNRAVIYHDDSANLSVYLDDVIDEKILFWLDAHLDNGVEGAAVYPKSICPLIHEIEAMKKLNKPPVVLIDDIRCIVNGEWGQDKTKVNLGLVIEKLKEVSPDYKFELIDGTIKDDILLAFIEEI